MDLPVEVLIYLFKYLPHGDRVAAGQTCRIWHEAASDNSFQNKQQICFTKNVIHENSLTDVFNSQGCQKFTSYKFREIDLESKLSKFWEQNGIYIKCLDFDECEMREKIFIHILNSCPNLESLSLSNCRELFMSASLLDDDLKNLCRDSLTNLKKLNLSKNRYLSDALFSRFIATTESLEELDLSECPISFHSGLHKKFYPSGVQNDDGNSFPSESILTFPYIYKFFKNKGSSLKKLCFNNTLFDGSALTKISELPHLKMTSFQAYGCDQLNKDGIYSLMSKQINLVELNLGMCSRVTDDILENICKNLVNLKSLNIRKCNMVTNTGAVELCNLKNLQHLDISQCNLITSEGLKNGICKEENTIMTELNISALNLEEYIIILISENLPNLKCLNMNLCFTSVTDNSIQAVFKNLLQLNTLCISSCDEVSDAGLTGMGMGKQSNSSQESTPVNGLTSTETYHRISLRSRAEEEIVKDAQRKKNVRSMCENYDGEMVHGYSLARLKSLQYLDLSGCNKITDVSLIYAFNSKELKSLFLNNCQQITYEGLGPLSNTCPSLEILELINCNNACDKAIREVVKNLHRLKTLLLRGCNQITDESIKAISLECKTLKILDIQSCRNISPELANSLYYLPTLHTLHVSKPGPYIMDEKKIPKAPPQLKFKMFRRIF